MVINRGDIKLLIDRLNQYSTGDEFQPEVESAVDMLERLGNRVAKLESTLRVSKDALEQLRHKAWKQDYPAERIRANDAITKINEALNG